MKLFYGKKNVVLLMLLGLLLLLATKSQAQEYNSFEVRYQNNLRGDLTFIGNNILNRDSGTAGEGPNDPYNNQRNNNSWSGSNNDNSGFTNYNDYKNMQYIDVDSDPSTFSSSTSTLAFEQADCNLIRYAGLYWSATYPSATANGSFDGFTYNANTVAVGTGRQTDFNQVKFRVPGGAYVDITADEVLFDGFTSTDTSVQQNSPYACYADVTSMITSLANPEGDYTVANIRATTGGLTPGGGTTGGWTLIIVYENPTFTGKFITTFDGFARVNGTNTVDIDYSGFETIPVGPVIADLGAATLEGDFRISGDGLSIEADSNSGFTAVGNTANPTDNFFNSNITLDGAITTNRTPASTNTLGYDTDIFLLNNPTNSVIPNNETAATFRFSTNGDQYYPFFNSFNVEVIEPNIVLEKRVEDIAGNDITGAGVNLGQFLDYVLSFQNIGNDDAINYTIRDILPINVTLDETNLNLPTGVTYTYTPATREVIFTIPDNLVEENDPASSIRMRVQVAENCFDFIDACTDQIENVAFSTYQGEINNAVITDDPSVNDFDTCGFVTPGATNFLLDDLDACDFSRTVQLCGDDVLLDAGDNFDAYFWYIDENNDGLIDAGDTLISGANTDTLLVTEVGTYIVDKQVADPCKGFQEIITVTLFGQTQSNPITALINDTSNTVEGQVVVCPNDGEELPEIFLCGLNDQELIQINIPDAQSIEWEQLDEASCTAATDDCANKNNTCTWNNVGNGGDFTASDAGQYRVVINYLNGCFSRFYFNIFKNPLDPQFNSSDIICNTPGNITVTNMPVDYEFQLVDTTNNNILVPYSSNNGPSFTIAANGAYRVEMRQQGVTDGCVFMLDNIGILDRDFQVDVVTRDTDCNGLGEISVSVLNVEAQYYYEISQGGTSVDTFGPSNDNNYTFENLNDGVYDVLVTTDDGCNYTEQVTINDVSDIAVSAITTRNIDCEDGIVTVTGTGGFPNPDYSYAIWSYVDESGTTITSYTDVSDIPAGEFQATSDFTFVIGEEGDYQFVVVDANNCTAISNIVTVEVSPAADFGSTLVVDVACFGESTGSITYDLINSNGYSLTYYLVPTDDFNNDNSSTSAGGITFTNDNTDVSSAIATNNSGTFINLPEGDYTVVINQSNGSVSCDYIENYVISAPADPVSANAVLVQDYTCLQDGIIEVQSVSGGTAPYEYSIDGINFDGSAGADVFTNLTDGTYNISIRDANNCVFVTQDIIIAPLNPPTDLTFTATNPVCPSLVSDVTATVVNGDAPFVFEIIAPSAIAATSTTGNSADFDGLSPGTYTFRVTDDKDCIYEESFTINPVSPITVVGQLVSNITCFDDTDGEARFTVDNFNTSFDYNIIGPSNFSGTAETNGVIDLTSLDDGTYTIVVTDNDTNCAATTNVTINGPPAALTITASESQPTCIADGSVTTTSNGGWGGNSFTIVYPDATTTFTNGTGSFSSLNQTGTYTISVTDVNGCSVSTTFDLTPAIAPVLAITANDICYDDATGLVLTANVTSGGDGNFEYSLNGGVFDTNNVFTGLGPGTYTIDVRDGNNCTDSETITINPELSVTATAPNITACATDTDIDITAAGGDGNYVYSVVPAGDPVGAFSTTNPVTVTGAGTYDVYVRDNNGNTGFCEATFEITVVQDAPITITPTVTDINCFGDSTGSISIAASGGEAPYTYNIDGGTFQTGTDFLNLAAGTYAIIARDANGCEETASVTVNQLDQIVAEATQTQNYTCTQDGEITVGSITPTTGGSGNYQYSINGGTWTASTTGGHTFTALTDGTYSISVRDALNTGCIITLADVIIAPLPVEPTLSESVTYNCDGTGNITVLPNDSSYTYSLNAGAPQTSNIFNNVAVGNHVITVDYGGNCTTDINVVVEPGNAFEATITAFENLDCNGDNSGSISFDADNFGTGGFEYSLDNFATAPLGSSTTAPVTISGLAAGNYTVTVRDVDNPISGCTITLNQNITEPTLVVADASITEQFTCNNSGATITASATGGTPSYEYQLENNSGTVIVAYQANPVFGGLTAGSYVIRARDANLCSDPIDTPITIVAPTIPTFTLTATNCYSGANDATIQVDVTAGNGNYLFSINGSSLVTPTPTSATTYTFTGLGSGTYTIDITDQYGCDAISQTITINPELSVTATAPNITACATDTDIDITAAGGDGNYVYSVVPDGDPVGAFSTTNPVTVTGAGTYDVYVRDNNGNTGFCEATFEITVVQDAPITITPTVTDINCFGDSTGSISIAASGGEAPYTYNIDGGTFQTGTDFLNLAAGTYAIIARDANGCEETASVTVNQLDQIVAEATQTQNYTCTQDGEITVGSITPTTGGSGNYQYSINGGTWTASTTGGHTFTALTDGTYSISVRDALNTGCIITLADVIIAPLPVEPTLSESVTYNCDGTGNITVLPNDSSYTYSLNAGAPQTSNIFNNVAVGNHVITVDYGGNCTTDINVVVEPGNAFEATITAFENLDCNGDNSGSISFDADNFGTGGFEYSLDNFATAPLGSSTTAPVTISGLAAGNYTVTVRDVDNPIAGCTITLNQNITEPALISVSNVLTQPTCIEDGSVLITATGGTGAYTYTIAQPNGAPNLGPQTNNTFTGLAEIGVHTITITDANGCTETDTFTTITPSNPTASIDAASNLCYASSSAGSATIVVGATGGLAPYFYSVNSGPLRTSNTFTDLIPGSYIFTVTDANGCTDDVAQDVEPQLTANLVLTKDLDCTASPDAVLTLNTSGGYSPFTYELNTNSGGYVSYTGSLPYVTASAGTYRFRVTDSQGCIAESNEIVVTPIQNPVATATATDPTCNGDTNGVAEINIDPSFGSSPFEVSFDGSAFSAQRVYAGLAAGTYSYTVRDSKNCTFTDTVTITDPALFNADVVPTDVSCGASGDIPGSISITITSGGVPNFTYILYDNLNNIVPVTGSNPIVNTTATSVVFDGLAFGDYYVRVIDANGCEYYENPVRVLANPYLSVDAVVPAVSCITGGTVDLLASGGSGDYTFTIFGAGTAPDAETPGPGVGEESATYNGLNTGQTYIFQVIDNITSCSSFVEVDIPALSAIDVVPDPIINDATCFGDTDGSIAFQFQDYDGTVTTIDYEIRESLTNTSLGVGYTGSVTGPLGPGPTPAVTISNIPPGDYVLYFIEATNPSCSNTYDFRILEPSPVVLNVIDQNNGNCNENANITVIGSGGTAPYTYAFVEDGVTPVAGDYSTNNYTELDATVNTDWDVYILDSRGCTIPNIDITIANDPSPVISAIVLNQCAADEGDFTIEVTLDVAGIQPFNLSLDGGSFQSSTLINAGDTYQFTNISSGAHTIEVRDFNGCGNLVNVDVFPPTSITTEVTTQPTCLGNDGEVLITAYGGSGVFLYELFDSGGFSIGGTGSPQPSPAFTGLNPGVYTAFVYDQVLTGCDAQVDINLEIPTAVQFTTTSTAASCFGVSDGTITVTLDPTSDNPPYTYQLFDVATGLIPQGPLQTSNIFTGLSGDDYRVRVFSGRGCQNDVIETVSEPLIITVPAPVIVEFGCTTGNNVNNASITVNSGSITGGSSNYITYEFIEEDDPNTVAVEAPVVVQSGANTTFIEVDPAGGVYTINVYDDNGCVGTTTATILPFDELLTATATFNNDLSCAPGNDGSITVTVTSTASDPTRFEYSIDNGVNYQTPNTFTGLTAGNYTILVRHIDTGCIISATETIEGPQVLDLDLVAVADVICFGSATGSANFDLNNAGTTYAAAIDYTLYFDVNNTPGNLADDTITNGSDADGVFEVTGLLAGNYFIEVTEANFPNCTYSENFSVAGPSAAITGDTAVTEITCNPGNDGIIEVIDVLGGWGDYQYYVSTTPNPDEFDASNYVANPRFENLTAGTYQIWVIDVNGCPEQLPDVTLADPTPIVADLQINNYNCVNLQGEIEVVGIPAINPVSGGQGSNYTYQLVRNGSNVGSAQNTTIFSGLGAGSFEVYILDQWGCNLLVGPVVLTDAMAATAAVVKPIDCTISPDGEITITVTGGSSNLDYTVTYPDLTTTVSQNNGVFTNLSQPGEYVFVITDLDTAIPCTYTVRQTLDPAILPVFAETHTDVTCNGANNGTIALSQTENGINPLTYTISPIAGTFNAATSTFENLPPNTYAITATGTNECTTTITNIIIDEPLIITVPAPVIVEFGCTTGNNVNNASITVNSGSITGGSSNYITYEFIEEDDPNTVAVEAPVVVQSGANTTFIEVDPAGGVYTINVYDDNGCVGTTTATILPFDELLTATATFNNDLSCAPGNDGSITVTVTSTASDPTRFEYSIDNGVNYQTPNTFTGLTAGNYTILVRHIDTGCIISATETIEGPQVLDLDLVAVADVICFGSATGSANFDLNNAGTTYAAAIDYTLYFDVNNTPGNLADDTITNGSDADGVFEVTGLLAGNYFIEVTEANFPNCTYSENFSVAGPSAAITGDTAVTEITCNPGNDGIIEVIDVLGGWGDYQYYVSTTPNPDEFDASNYVANPRFENLTAGTYQIWVIDVNGCPEQLPDVTLADPTPIVADLQINNYNCVNLQGEIEVVGIPAINPVSGGQGSNYTYQLVRNGSNVGSAQNTTIFSGLGAGSFEVYILDQWGCNLLVGPVVLTDAMAATAAVVKPIDCTISPDGEITITVTGGSSNLDYTVTYPDLTTTVSQNNGVFTNLSQPGEYVFVITDLDTAIPCTYTVRQTLDAPVDPILLDALVEDVSCFGGSDGSITAVLDAATATNPDYTYELYRTSDLVTPIRVAQASPLFENLDADSYQVRVISARSCDDVKVEVVGQPNALSASASATPFACAADNTVNTSTITITAIDGTAPYLYSIDNVNFQTSHTFEIIDNGATQTIAIYVVDANGCPFTTDVTIQPLNTFTAAVALDNAISCANPEQVTITVTETGTPGDVYSFELLPIPNTNGVMTSSTNTTAAFDLSVVGNYTFRVTNTTTGCYVDTAPYEITPFDLIDVVATATTPVSCFGTATGALEINITGYTGNYDYQIFDSSNNPVGAVVSTDTSINPRPITNVPGGNYYIRVTETDVPLCLEDSNTVTIISPAAALSTVVSIEAPVTCDNNQGEILVTPSGGYAPYDIVLTNTTSGQVYNIADVTSYLFDSLSAGNFTIDVSDNGSVPCIDNATETLVPAIPITADITATPTTLLCFGDTNATVSAINVLNGEGVYQYQLNEYDVTGTTIAFTSGSQISPDFNNLGAGIYSITVSDGWNCDVETVQVTITEPTDVMASLIQLTELTCANDAQIELSASGGTGPYQFSTDGSVYTAMTGGNSHTFSVVDGVYQYYVRDSFGCEAMISNQITVDPVPPLTIAIDDSAAFINCTGEASATIIANVTGGLGNYSYELFADAGLTNLMVGPQTNDTFSGLVAGSYYVRVTSQDCEEVSGEIIITDPAPLQIDVEEFTDVTCSGLDDGTITVEVSGGTGEIQYAITPNLNQFDTVNTFDDLAPGVYDVIAQDRNGCFIPFQFTIDEPQPLDLVTVSVLDEICEGDADGSIEVSISGGTAPYSTAFNSNADADFIQDQTLFTDLAAGTYVIFVRDAQGCEENIIVEIESGVNLNAVVTPVYECSGDTPDNYIDVVLEDSSVGADVLYGLDADPMQLAPDFTNMAPGMHTLTIAHANGCLNTIDFEIQDFAPLTLILEQNNINEITAIAGGGLEDYTFYFDGIDNGDDNTYIINRTDTYTVRVVDQNGCEMVAQIEMEFIDIEIPNFFTPDGDGNRDAWAPDNLEAFPNILTIIFDRYGRELYRMELNTAPWEGNYQGHRLPTGDYWYVIKLKGENDDREFVGHFTLYR